MILVINVCIINPHGLWCMMCDRFIFSVFTVLFIFIIPYTNDFAVPSLDMVAKITGLYSAVLFLD